MRRYVCLVILAAAALAGSVAAQFSATSVPVKDGVRATADLPASEHHRNVGGSDGAGLCVYTSAWHAAIWQDVRAVWSFRKWMERRPGGSYPDKFAQTLAAYCRETGVEVPAYVQHTGGDVEFLKLAIRTGRMPCVTYCGVDGPGSYGNEVIAHMVNLVHLDDSKAAILDNNYPGRWLWMSSTDFLSRWKGVRADGQPYYGRDSRGRAVAIGGGWAIVWLASPPAPYASAPAPGVQFMIEQCANGRCPIPAAGPEPIGNAPTDAHEWGVFPNGQYGWRFKVKPVDVEAAPAADPFPGGVVSDRINPGIEYWLNGRKVTPFEGVAAVASTLSDDSARWNLTAVGNDAFIAAVREDFEKLPADVRAKLHVQTYSQTGAGAWAANQFKLSQGVTLRRPAVGRIGADVGVIPAAEYTSAKLVGLIGAKGGPDPKPEPVPANPAPVPVKPDDKKSDPAIPARPAPWFELAAVVFLLWLILKPKGR